MVFFFFLYWILWICDCLFYYGWFYFYVFGIKLGNVGMKECGFFLKIVVWKNVEYYCGYFYFWKVKLDLWNGVSFERVLDRDLWGD